MTKPFVSLLLASTALLVACGQQLNHDSLSPHAIGVIEINFDDQGKLSTASLLPNQNTPANSISFTPSSFVVTSNATQKYLNARFNITNNTGATLTDVTLVAYQQNGNQAGTALKNVQNFAGLSPTQLDAYAQQAKPINGVNASIPIMVNSNAADLQVFSEAEISGLTGEASSVLQSGEYLFPYGFVVRASAGTSRAIAPGSNTGAVTVGVNVPNSNEPSSSVNRFTMTFIAFTQPVTSRVTESVEEQGTSSASTRKTAFAASDLMTLGGSSVNSSTRQCQVRVAGSASNPSAFLVDTVSVTGFSPTANAVGVTPSTSLTLSLDRSVSSVNSGDLVVLGSLSGVHGGVWSGVGTTSLTFTPSVVFKPGELVTVGLRLSAVWCEARMWQFLVGVTPSVGASFAPKSDFGTGASPYSVALGDVNGDGKLDIVTANYGASTSSVLLGNGNGTFQTKVDYPTGAFPLSVALGDVNGDGKLDIVTANQRASTSSVLLGNGNGTFQTNVDYATGGNLSSAALGDVNGDGKLDIVTANSPVNSSSVLLGNGDGTFQTKVDYPTGAFPVSVALGDVNGDGKLDIVTANYAASTSSVLLGNGNGTFQAKVDYATGGNPSSVALGDVNGDGKLDIVTANYGANSSSVLLRQ